jgi:hypothetical protein
MEATLFDELPKELLIQILSVFPEEALRLYRTSTNASYFAWLGATQVSETMHRGGPFQVHSAIVFALNENDHTLIRALKRARPYGFFKPEQTNYLVSLLPLAMATGLHQMIIQ